MTLNDAAEFLIGMIVLSMLLVVFGKDWVLPAEDQFVDGRTTTKWARFRICSICVLLGCSLGLVGIGFYMMVSI